jgi:putative transposase
MKCSSARGETMPRANRYFLPGHVWHITHRCHEKSFLLKFTRDRAAWTQWLFEAKKRFGLCVLNYMATSNHVHLLVKCTGEDAIPRSMQLIAGRTAQAFNTRKRRHGAYWEDRYHATAVETDEHLHRCLVYIDLNMVRAGVVRHPRDWPHCGHREIDSPKTRYRIVDIDALSKLCGFSSIDAFRHAYRLWLEAAVADIPARDERWSTSIAVGTSTFVERVVTELRDRARHRNIEAYGETHALREEPLAYEPHFDPENAVLRGKNSLLWDVNLD